MEIKRITFPDRHLVTDLFNKYRIFYKKPSDMKLAESFIADRLRNDESVIFLAFEGEEGAEIPIGFTQLYPKFSSGRAIKIWVLNDLYVEEGHRKKSVGNSLIKAALNYAKSDGVSLVELQTAVDNYTAQSLYESMGFVKQDADSEFLGYQIEV
ncbi:GNAT family N-acetyltransferase [Daejeonella lutea]|uniref:Acetyltransferase (GNAT) family protein n=1 Tax=Daejeonella lutea TaxID=572036 RepID=A0A1T5CY41_9SPHI|nr:GNAT family N-acetyltransferase [Daejeonella lutea]SKB64382.1 Acetyltransferase (GNAT) family protein [Daejeonella lutea]